MFDLSPISLVISFEFYDIKQEDQNEDKIGIKRTILDFFEIMSVNRLKSIFLVGFVFSGIIYVTATLYKSILIDMGLETEYITIVVFFFTLTCDNSIFSRLILSFKSNCFFIFLNVLSTSLIQPLLQLINLNRYAQILLFDKSWNLLRINKRGLEAPKGFTLPKPEKIDEMFDEIVELS